MPTKYLVTPHKGRIGKARQVSPFTVEVDALPHNLNKLALAISRAVVPMTRHRDLTTAVYVEGPSHCFKAEVFFANDTLVAQLHVEALDA